jgi:2-polyprenyl-6-methoxyphenol hydroxylase-like FAD-dependent oxidoreductase
LAVARLPALSAMTGSATVAPRALRPGWQTPQVIIVGAGPVGLSLAIELGLRSIPVTLLEARDGSVHVPKMSQLTVRTVEFCRRWGLQEQVMAAGWPVTHPMDFLHVTSMTGFEIYRRKTPSYRQQPSFPYSPTTDYHCPQIFFDPVLQRFAATLGSVSLAYMTELEDFAMSEDGVVARARDTVTGEKLTLPARFLVGCDGGPSLVRRKLDIGLGGEGRLDFSLSIFFRSAGLARIHDKGWARFYKLIDGGGHWGDLVAIDGKELWRLTILTGFKPGYRFDDGDVEHYIRRAAGVPVAYEIISILPWERMELVADRYRQGPVFIAGDAAHQNSPTGGLGMNTGVADAVDLAWKLAGRLEGWGGETLLASYEIERRPVALRNVAECSRLFHEAIAIPALPEIEQASKAGEMARRRVAEALRGTDSISPNIRLGYCYEGSPIVCPDGTPPLDPTARAFIPSARPGTRAPHAWIADGRSTLDLFGGGFTLLQLGSRQQDVASFIEAAKARGLPLRHETIARDDIAALYEAPLVLVRPDGHVAWRGERCPRDPGTVLDVARGHAVLASEAIVARAIS